MKRFRSVLTSTVALAGLVGVFIVNESSATKSTSSGVIQKQIGNFRLVDQTGFARELFLLRDAKAIVIGAHVVGDESAAKTAESFGRLKEKYPDVEFMMINSSLEDDRDTIAAAAAGAPVPVLDDENQLIGESLGIERSGEVVVIDPQSMKVVYKGALDRASADKNAKGFLEEALTALDQGAAVKVALTSVRGAPIAFPAREKADQFAEISYSSEIAPILEQKCVACHSEGGIAPFAMDSYETVKGFAPMIAETIRTDRMPPWEADPHVGKFSNDKSLSNDEIKTIVHWIEAGTPRGQGPDPLDQERIVAKDWPLGEPDLILDIPAFDLPASGVVDYQYPWIANPLDKPRWLKASTIKAGTRQGVHHILSAASLEAPEEGAEGERAWASSVASLGDYAVGAESTLQPENIGVKLPAGGAFSFQMHYTPYGKAVTDKSQIGLYFYEEGETPELLMREVVIADSFIQIPPGAAEHKEVAYIEFPADAILYSAFPHAHLRAVYADVQVQYPDGSTEMLLRLPRYDFNWQRYYDFATPIDIPAGSRLITTYIYDNSTRNPANPDPTKEVVWGAQSFEEMHYTKIRYRWVGETATRPLDHLGDELLKSRVRGIMDANLDGMIQRSELRGPLQRQAGYFDRFDLDKNDALDDAELEPVMTMLTRAATARAEGGGAE